MSKGKEDISLLQSPRGILLGSFLQEGASLKHLCAYLSTVFSFGTRFTGTFNDSRGKMRDRWPVTNPVQSCPNLGKGAAPGKGAV